jgi:hypothetical protein
MASGKVKQESDSDRSTVFTFSLSLVGLSALPVRLSEFLVLPSMQSVRLFGLLEHPFELPVLLFGMLIRLFGLSVRLSEGFGRLSGLRGRASESFGQAEILQKPLFFDNFTGFTSNHQQPNTN